MTALETVQSLTVDVRRTREAVVKTSAAYRELTQALEDCVRLLRDMVAMLADKRK
jgi:hypothetical protein